MVSNPLSSVDQVRLGMILTNGKAAFQVVAVNRDAALIDVCSLGSERYQSLWPKGKVYHGCFLDGWGIIRYAGTPDDPDGL